MKDFTRIVYFSREYQAELAKSLLESEGIPSFILNRDSSGLGGLTHTFSPGYYLVVPQEFAEEAKQVLAKGGFSGDRETGEVTTLISGDKPAEEDGEDEQPTLMSSMRRGGSARVWAAGVLLVLLAALVMGMWWAMQPSLTGKVVRRSWCLSSVLHNSGEVSWQNTDAGCPWFFVFRNDVVVMVDHTTGDETQMNWSATHKQITIITVGDTKGKALLPSGVYEVSFSRNETVLELRSNEATVTARVRE